MENLCNSDLFLLVEKKKKWRRYLRNKRKRNKQKKKHCWFQNFGLHCGTNASERDKDDFLKN